MDEMLRLRAKAVVEAADSGDMPKMAEAMLALRKVLVAPPMADWEIDMIRVAAKRGLGEGSES